MTAPVFAPGTAAILRCGSCGTTHDIAARSVVCPTCGGLLDVLHPKPSLRGTTFAAAFDAAPSGVWRFASMVMGGAGPRVSWPEGNTPLIERTPVTAYGGAKRILVKHEGMNPTGSFKDRGMTVAMTHALRRGASAVACASTGNTAASLAAYAAAAGIPALVFVPRGRIALGKLAQSTAYGARTLVVDTDFDGCLTLAREAASSLGVYLANSVNPWRLEGQKTIVWELLAQMAGEIPDWIALPAGALGNTSAFGKALREARALGLIAKVPRLLAVQAAGAAPFARGFEGGFATRERVKAETVATAIRIGAPASWDRAVRAIRETDGAVTAVTDAEILEAKAVIDAAGIGCEPASAASLAGVRTLRARGVIAADATVACVLTGHLLKDPETTAAFHASGAPRTNAPVEIPANLAAVERVIREATR